MYPASELAQRKANYDMNVARIEKHNAEGHSWTMGVNKFADWSDDEWKAYVSKGKKNKSNKLRNKSRPSTPYVPSGVSVPASWDWRTVGAVTPVKDQGQCGA